MEQSNDTFRHLSSGNSVAFGRTDYAKVAKTETRALDRFPSNDSDLSRDPKPVQPLRSTNFRAPNDRSSADRSSADSDSHSDGKAQQKSADLNSAELNYAETFQRLTADLAKPLAKVEAIIADSLSSQSASTSELLDHVRKLGGKRLRPILTLLSAYAASGLRVGNELPEETYRCAAVVELVHTATLVHDDVIDEAAMRRHLEALHVLSSSKDAILIGDWIFTQAYALASRGNSTVPGRVVAECAKAVCEGEIRQDANAGNFAISEEECMVALMGKTGMLCGAACRLGAWSVGGSLPSETATETFGQQVGLAFQIRDDWLDYWGDETKAGKTLLTDLTNSRPTIPLLRALAKFTPEQRSLFFKLNTDRKDNWRKDVLHLLETTDTSVYTEHLASALASSAVNSIAKLPGKVAVKMLAAIGAVSTSRTR